MQPIQDWLGAYKSDARKIAILVNALGASEFWGQNVNGDIFPEGALIHDCRCHPSEQHPIDDFTGKVVPPYGYWTFLQAYPYVHHRNKDPTRAFGNVAVTCWNPTMRRVELVVLIDRHLAMQHDAQHIVDRIDRGDYPDVSMGCRVPYDICSICGHKSKTRNDYCSCIKNIGMGKILDDGRRIGVINTYPRFFDISFVFIGADKTAKMMCKLANASIPQSVIDAEQVYHFEETPEGIIKAACGRKSGCAECHGKCKVAKPEKVTKEDIVAGLRGAAVGAVKGHTPADAILRAAQGVVRNVGIVEAKKERPLKVKGVPKNLSQKQEGLLAKKLIEKVSSEQSRLTAEVYSEGTDEPARHRRLTRETEDGQSKMTVEKLAPPPPSSQTLYGREDPQDDEGVRILSTNEDMPTDGVEDDAKLSSAISHVLPHGVERIYRLIGHPDTIESLDKQLLAMQAAGDWGSSRGIRSSIDGDGPEWLKVEGVPGSLDKETLKKEMDKDEINVYSLKKESGFIPRLPRIVPSRLPSASDVLPILGTAGLGGATVLGTALIAMGPQGRKRLAGEVHDPRLYSNLRGMFTGESREERVKAHKLLERGEQERVLDAMRSGFGRKKLSSVYKMGPPPSPNRDKFPFVGTLNFRGLLIYVENAPGTWRTGPGWKTLMKVPYGEFARSLGTDGDKLDVYVGADKEAENVFIVHQNHVYGPKKGEYDEDKVMLGFRTAAQAKKAYLDHYDSPKFFRSMTTMAFPLFKKALLRREMDGEKVASRQGEIMNFYLARARGESPTPPGGVDRRGEVVSHYLEKTAESLKLEDLFESASTPDSRRRQRTWRDKATGKETSVTGSGMDDWGKVKEARPIFLTFKTKKEQMEFLDRFRDRWRKLEGEARASGWKPFMQEVREGQTKTAMWVPGRGSPRVEVDFNNRNIRVEDVILSLDSPGGRRALEENQREAVMGTVKNIDPSFYKVASARVYGPMDLYKLSTEDKEAAKRKWAEIVKQVGPSKAVGQTSPLLSASEPSIPRAALDAMGAKGLESALATPSLMGMVLKPREFQRISLVHMGKKDLADQLDDAGACFRPRMGEEGPCSCLEPHHADMDILRMLLPLLSQRSYYGPVVRRRIIRITMMKPEPPAPEQEVDSPLLSKVASAYNWYRREQIKVAASSMAKVTAIPELHAAVHGLEDGDFFKTAALPDKTTLGLMLGSVPLTLMYSAHLRSEKERGENLSALGRFVADHPWLTSLATMSGTRALMETPAARQKIDEGIRRAAGAAGALRGH